ncbi:hypothetical protein BGW36DRAFT_296459 [Talaromyces proteolyticus]|uniref:Zn(2)-C6 fungal-type domain-containing protein n=1 Tax=Talaromyces proteolyticus TaxID=1131652 RepID=A0AAD4Q0B5_9EURO|nr:uncharacterized protein BGW36DRAFT_296459 [Talaromyces proteolyticus]KAH8697096.1 hypothetical protein BGW36DRAFT_296459 [Talaromyces proteolyticus]
MDGKTRLRKACDACSIRKVKCDESGPPCRSCAALDIPCTYNRPSRRRGPPNKHAEALKKPKTEHDPSELLTSDQSALATSGESICPLPTLQLLIDDYFTFIHPLVPVPHEPIFRAAFSRREDVTNKRFLALLAAMIGCLVASFPRRPKLHLKTDAERHMYPNSITLVKRCHDVAVQARGAGYLDTSTTIDDAAISYHLSLCSGYVYNLRRCRMYLGECMTILRVYNLYAPSKQIQGPSPMAASPLSGWSDQFGEPNIPMASLLAQELGRRLFYVCLVGFQTLHQLGSTDGRIYVPPETPTDRYPPLPVEVDDEYVFPTHIDPQPIGIVSQLTGFNANVRVFQCYNPLAALEIAFGSNDVLGWERQRQMIWESLQKAKSITAELPPELSLNPQVQISSPSMNWPPSYARGGENEEQRRRKIQYEIQKANIYISQLSTRSYLVDKYWTLFEGHKRLQDQKSMPSGSQQLPSPDTIPLANVKSEEVGGGPATPDADLHAQTDFVGQVMREERGLVIKDLLCLLKSVQEIHIEPNGASFTYKVRQIASTLLNLPRGPDTTIAHTSTSTTATGPQPLSTADAESYLRTFLDILVRLEGVGVTNTNHYNQKSTATHNNNNNHSDYPNHGGSEASSPFDPLVSFTAAPSTALPSPDITLRAMSYGDGSSEEEEELKQWASLKEFQKRFIEDEGHLYST